MYIKVIGSINEFGDIFCFEIYLYLEYLCCMFQMFERSEKKLLSALHVSFLQYLQNSLQCDDMTTVDGAMNTSLLLNQ